VVIAACAASAGAHAALAPEHMNHERALGVAFVAAALALSVATVQLIVAPGSSGASHAVVLLLAALIGAYWLKVTTGLPWLADTPEPVDAVGITTKLVEALGLVFALQLNQTRGGRGSLTHEEARP
jgi:hypothetical protein